MFNKKTKEDITNTLDWFIKPDGTLVYNLWGNFFLAESDEIYVFEEDIEKFLQSDCTDETKEDFEDKKVNKKDRQLRNCIFLTFDEYKSLIFELTDGLKQVLYEYDGIYYTNTKEANNTQTYWNGDIEDALSKYFDVEVTSVHADDCDCGYLGIWICYR